MAPREQTIKKMASKEKISKHQWTDFQIHTLLCLLAKGIHIKAHIPVNNSTSTTSRYNNMNVATALNRALNNGDYTSDVPVRAVALKIEELMISFPAAVQTMERQRVGVMTRTLRKVWKRGIRFDGSKKTLELKKQMENARLVNALEDSIDKVVINGLYVPVGAIGGLLPVGETVAAAAALKAQRAAGGRVLYEQTPARKRPHLSQIMLLLM